MLWKVLTIESVNLSFKSIFRNDSFVSETNLDSSTKNEDVINYPPILVSNKTFVHLLNSNKYIF